MASLRGERKEVLSPRFCSCLKVALYPGTMSLKRFPFRQDALRRILSWNQFSRRNMVSVFNVDQGSLVLVSVFIHTFCLATANLSCLCRRAVTAFFITPCLA
ncbi:unnamed protein product, partial [Discosporangium mesarthrocarpum]